MSDWTANAAGIARCRLGAELSIGCQTYDQESGVTQLRPIGRSFLPMAALLMGQVKLPHRTRRCAFFLLLDSPVAELVNKRLTGLVGEVYAIRMAYRDRAGF